MLLIFKLAAAAFIISVIVWGAFGYLIAPYLMGQKPFVKRKGRVPIVALAHDMAAAVVVMASPQPMIIQVVGAPHDTFQLTNVTANASGELIRYNIEGQA